MDKSYKQARSEQYNQKSRDRLSRIIKKKIETTMIGALSSVEEKFKFLWDGDTKEHKAMQELYQNMRSEILDKGNRQVRNVDTELSHYTITWNQYNYTLPVIMKTLPEGGQE